MNTDHDQELGPLNEWVNAVKNEEFPTADYDQARRNLLQRLPEPKQRAGVFLLRNPLAACLTVAAVAVLVMSPFLGGGGQAYAKVVASFNRAVTIAFSADWYFDGHPEPTKVEMAFRTPGLQRMVVSYQGEETIQVNDTDQNRGLILVPSAKTYIEVDLQQMPDTERERINLIRLVTDELRSIPETADEILDEMVIENREVRGFRVGRRTLWIDEDQEELVQMELDLGGMRMVMTRFRFDPPELQEEMFSITPPDDYLSATDQALVYDMEDVGEADLIDFLRFMAMVRTDSQFPAMINPMEILTLQERGLLREDQAASLQETQENGRSFARASQRAVMFVMGMNPDRAWHYAGKDVILGTPDTPIAWWKPTGEDSYRVLWADLTLTDETGWNPGPNTE